MLVCDMQHILRPVPRGRRSAHARVRGWGARTGEGPDLEISKSVSPNPLVAGMPGTYTIVSTNNGPGDAYDVSITEYDVVGVELQGVSCPDGLIDIQADRVVCTWPGVTSVGQSRTMVLSGRVCPEINVRHAITNRATTSAGEGGGGEPTVILYGTMGYGSQFGPSTLYELDPETGDIIREIGRVGYTVNGLAYDATNGTLYGSTSVNDPSWTGLIEIDTSTGAGTPIGLPIGAVPCTWSRRLRSTRAAGCTVQADPVDPS